MTRRRMHPECVAQRYCISAKSNLSPCVIPPRKDSEKEERKGTPLHSSQKAKQLTILHKQLTTSTLQRIILLRPRAVYPLRPHTTQYIYHKIIYARVRRRSPQGYATRTSIGRFARKAIVLHAPTYIAPSTNLYCSRHKAI